MDEQNQDDQPEPTYNSSVSIRNVALKTCRKRWTIEKGGGRGSGISVLMVWHDDDDGDDIYIYIQLKEEEREKKEKNNNKKKQNKKKNDVRTRIQMFTHNKHTFVGASGGVMVSKLA